jgi:hypothetical protein
MRVHPKPGDTPEMLELMRVIDFEWETMVRLRKESEAADRRHGLARAKLRLLHEGLVEGEELRMGPTQKKGILEVSADVPYLWLRLLDKAGGPAKRRLKLDEGTRLWRPDGSTPTPWSPELSK